MNLNPIADTFVNSNKPSTNYGTQTTANVDGSPMMVAYLKFDLTSLSGASIKSAKLRIKIADDASNSTQSLDAVSDTAWDENRMTYTNRPAIGSLLGTFTSPKTYTWVEIDITAQVIANKGYLMSLAIHESSKNSLDVYTKESASNKPVLVITY